MLNALDRHADALAAATQPCCSPPNDIGILNTRSVALQNLGRFDEAQAVRDNALCRSIRTMAPRISISATRSMRSDTMRRPRRHSGNQSRWRRRSGPRTRIIGGALLGAEQYDNALNSFDRAIELGSQSEGRKPTAALSISGSAISSAAGPSIIAASAPTDRKNDWRDYQWPLWNGEALDGSLLVWGEQGLGDQILYASMIDDLRARVPAIVIEAEKRLVPLFARSFPGIEVVPLVKELHAGPHAAHIPIGTLGQHLRTSWDSFPKTQGGFLKADPVRTSALRARIKTDDRLVIGVSWRSANKKFEKAKSAGLHAFEPLLTLPNCRFVDLQYGDTPRSATGSRATPASASSISTISTT